MSGSGFSEVALLGELLFGSETVCRHIGAIGETLHRILREGLALRHVVLLTHSLAAHQFERSLDGTLRCVPEGHYWTFFAIRSRYDTNVSSDHSFSAASWAIISG